MARISLIVLFGVCSFLTSCSESLVEPNSEINPTEDDSIFGESAQHELVVFGISSGIVD